MLVLAVDGGGTRCRVAASDGQDTVSVESGSANASTDFDGAVREISIGLEKIARRLGCPVEALRSAPAFVGLAGVVGSAISDRLHAALPFQHLRVADDRVAAVRGVLGQRDGVLGHCGTGSFFAAQRDGEIRLSGGWGPVLGDEASAQWVGRLALRWTLEAVDGRLALSPMGEQLLADFGGAASIVHFAGSAGPSEFGGLAPTVTDWARRQDELALKVMHKGADEIARAVRCLGWHPGRPFCLTGGFGPQYAPYMPQDLRDSLAEPLGEPLDGAIALARDFAREIAHDRC